MSEKFLLTAITSDPAFIRAADNAGVDRVGIDIERLGKACRQGHIAGSRISDQRLEELSIVAQHVRRAEVFVRVNPVHARSGTEIDQAVALGAQTVMLPQFKSAEEVERFVELLGGRATPVLLLETAEALAQLNDIVRVGGVTEVMVGLNDMHMALGMSNHFEVVVSDTMAWIGDVVRGAGLRFGFGGVAHPEDLSLPVPPDLVMAQYSRLGGTSAWLSRSFFRGLQPSTVSAAVAQVRKRLSVWQAQPRTVLDAQREELVSHLRTMEPVGA